MATVRKYWRCSCRNPETGKARGYKKVYQGEKDYTCPHCGAAMYLAESNVARVTVNGKTVTHAHKAKTVVNAFIEECRRSKRTGDLLPGQEEYMTWASGIETFEKWLENAVGNKEISAKTRKYYLDGLRPLRAEFNGLCLQEIEKKDAEAFKTKRRKEVAASTVNCSLSALKRLYTVICDGLRTRDYPRLHEAKEDIFKTKLLKLNNKNENFLETDEEIQALLAECRTPTLFKFVFTILNTGLRPIFALSLKKSEFNFKSNQIRKTVKGGTKVIIPLTEQYKLKVEAWFKELKVCGMDPYLIPSPVDPLSCMKSDSNFGFKKACQRAATALRKAGQKESAERMALLTPHHLRHTFATHYLFKTSKKYGATVAVFQLSKILGHSTTYITERYSHVLEQINQGAMQTYGDEVFNGIDFEPQYSGQPRCECGAYLLPDGSCKRCLEKGVVGIHVGNK